MHDARQGTRFVTSPFLYVVSSPSPTANNHVQPWLISKQLSTSSMLASPWAQNAMAGTNQTSTTRCATSGTRSPPPFAPPPPRFPSSFLLWSLRKTPSSQISNGRKTDKIGVIGFRTNETNNELGGDDAYEKISVFAPIDQFLMPNVRELQSLLVPSNTNNGDGISALVTGIQMIMAHCKHLKYIKNVILVTNGTGQFDTDGLDEIASQIRAQNINLTVLGVDFDDEEYGCKEEGKPARKRKVEEDLKKLCADVDGVFGTIQEAVEELGRPRIKTVRPVASYKGPLSLGDASKYDTALTIDVERYPRTMVAKPVSASRFVATSSGDNEEGGSNSSKTIKVEDKWDSDLLAVRQARAYQVENEEVAGEKMEIDKEEMEKGYTYGRTVVPISATDEEVTVLATEPSMQIVGFIAAEKV
jgi:ATP-dependent DNA helicase 2 subunit 2